MIKRIECVELYNSYDINLNYQSFSHCCKMKMFPIDKEQLSLYGGKFFDLNNKTVRARTDLQNGVQTELCQDCWNNENKNLLSWRQLRNKRLSKAPKPYNVYTLNLQISNLCNQSCYYCVPELSSSISKYGTWVDNNTGKIITFNKNNQEKQDFNTNYIKEFITSIPEHIDSLQISITGGEPFLLPNFEIEFLEFIKLFLDLKEKNNLILVISTNTNVKSDKLLQFYEKIYKNNIDNRIKVYISCSIENLEDRAEYVRDGLIWSNFLENFKIHKNNADYVGIRMTINPFTIVKISDFVKFFADKDVNFYYNYPHQSFFRISILDERFLIELKNLEEYIIKKNIAYRFENEFYKDLSKMIVNDTVNADIFRSAITNIDKIKHVNWRQVFPEYINWFDKN